MRNIETEIAVIGGGPAGLAAAAAASPAARVALLDDNPHFGGQIWRASMAKIDDRAVRFVAQLDADKAALMHGAAVHSVADDGALLGEDLAGPFRLGFDKLIVATGARELFLPFPGWTLPGVFGAGGLQALAKGVLDVTGKRILIAGSGPLLLAVAAYLKHRGAVVISILEQAPRQAINRFAFGLLKSPQKLLDAAALRFRLGAVPYKPDSWITACERTDEGLLATYSSSGRTRSVLCDYVACGFHLVPSTELALMLGCRMHDRRVWVDDLQCTSQPDIYCAGEATGVGGVELSIAEGRIAGWAASGQEGHAANATRQRDRLRQFADRMNIAFAIRDEVTKLAGDSTIVCRCEDVTFQRLKVSQSWREAKLQTRCGMGPCQGRICGEATRHLFGWGPADVRPPLFPVKLENL